MCFSIGPLLVDSVSQKCVDVMMMCGWWMSDCWSLSSMCVMQVDIECISCSRVEYPCVCACACACACMCVCVLVFVTVCMRWCV